MGARSDGGPSHEEEHGARRRRYLTITVVRVVCLAVAVVLLGSWWLALVLVLLTVPLAWIAVLTADDRPPRATAVVAHAHPVTDG